MKNYMAAGWMSSSTIESADISHGFNNNNKEQTKTQTAFQLYGLSAFRFIVIIFQGAIIVPRMNLIGYDAAVAETFIIIIIIIIIIVVILISLCLTGRQSSRASLGSVWLLLPASAFCGSFRGGFDSFVIGHLLHSFPNCMLNCLCECLLEAQGFEGLFPPSPKNSSGARTVS